MTITESFVESCKMAIAHEFKNRHSTQRGIYSKAENIRDAIAILRRIQSKITITNK